MSKSADLLKNTGILAIGSFSSKLLTFLLVPLYTAVLTTGEYGAYDIISSAVSLLIPILTLNVSDAVLRFPLDEGEDVPSIARFGIVLTLASGVLVLVAQLAPGAPWGGVPGIDYLAPLYLATSLYQLLTLLARGTQRFVDIAVAGILSTIVIVGLNILLLLVLPCGLDGYFVANIAGFALASAFLLVRMRSVVFGHAAAGVAGLAARMVRYSLPLAFTVVGWWFINTSGRFIVVWACGMEANGLFSVAYKIPTILSTLASIFIQAWQVSAIKDFDGRDSDGFLRRTYGVVELLLVLSTSCLMALSPLIASFLYSGDFYSAWVYVPFLLISALLNAMAGMWGPFFSATYRTRPMAVSTVVGGVVNVGIGVPLAHLIGVQGVALAAMLSSLANWAYRGVAARSFMEADFRMGRSMALYGLLAAQAFATVIGVSTVSLFLVDVLVIAIVLVLCRDRVGSAKRFLFSSVKKRVR